MTRPEIELRITFADDPRVHRRQGDLDLQKDDCSACGGPNTYDLLLQIRRIQLLLPCCARNSSGVSGRGGVDAAPSHPAGFRHRRSAGTRFFDRFRCSTGETGAGKSILVDALVLALGDPGRRVRGAGWLRQGRNRGRLRY